MKSSSSSSSSSHSEEGESLQFRAESSSDSDQSSKSKAEKVKREESPKDVPKLSYSATHVFNLDPPAEIEANKDNKNNKFLPNPFSDPIDQFLPN